MDFNDRAALVRFHAELRAYCNSIEFRCDGGSGMSQKELAEKVGISRSAIGMYETGEREPDFETLEAFADIFNVNMDTLLGKISTDEINHIQNPNTSTGSERKISDDDIKFALFGGDGEITDAMYDEVKRFAQMVKLREEIEKKKG